MNHLAVLNAMLQLSSPALPIGGFSYSQGLESAVNVGLVKDQASALDWIESNLKQVIGNVEAIVWVYLYRSWKEGSLENTRYWNQWFWASRETSEFRAETIQMGWSFIKLLQELEWGGKNQLDMLTNIPKATLPCAHSYACFYADIGEQEGLNTYLYTWLENQVMAAIKSIPLGQVAGQKILLAALKTIPTLVEEIIKKMDSPINPINTFSPQLSILSARHENQYSRLFRS